MSNKTFNVLFLCTGNSARSVLGEALLNDMGKSRFRAYSAGSFPNGRVNPWALRLLSDAGLPIDGLRSKSWDEFAKPDAPKMDFVFTVCDNAAGETCPVWPGKPVTAHWGIEDPAAVEGSDEDKHHAFHLAAERMRSRIRLFLSLPFDKLDHMSLKARVSDIGKTAG